MAYDPSQDDDEDGLDPRIKGYLKQQMDASLAERSPAYQASLRADAGDAAAQKRSNNLSALLMSSAAKFGTVGGKTADSADYDRFTQAQNKGIDQDQAAMSDQNRQADAIDPRIMQYLARSDQNKQRTAAAAQRDKEFNAKLASDQQGRADSNELKKTLAQSAVDAKKTANDAAVERNKQRQDDKDTAANDRNDKATNDRFDKFDQRIAGTVRDEIGGEKSKLRATTHAFGILDKYPDLDKVTNKQALEIAGAMAGTLTQGTPAQHTIQNMTPASAMGDLAQVLEYVTGSPQGAGLGAQLKLYKEMLERQRDVSTDIIGNAIAPHIQNFSDLKDKNPKKFNDILTSAGITLDDNGQFQAYQPRYVKKTPADLPGGTVPGTAMAAPAGGTPKPTPGKIHVSNGKETLEIDPADEASAAADGYKRVGG